jgi:hypothetical protein
MTEAQPLSKADHDDHVCCCHFEVTPVGMRSLDRVSLRTEFHRAGLCSG